MKQYIGCDAHARYSVFVSVDETGRTGPPVRVDHFGCGLYLICRSRAIWKTEAADGQEWEMTASNAPDIEQLLADENARKQPPKRLPPLAAMTRDFQAFGDGRYGLTVMSREGPWTGCQTPGIQGPPFPKP